jgi:hypothetical protein
LQSLISLDLYDNQLTGKIPSEIANIKTLKKLKLTQNYLSGVIPPKIASQPNMGDCELQSAAGGSSPDHNSFTYVRKISAACSYCQICQNDPVCGTGC